MTRGKGGKREHGPPPSVFPLWYGGGWCLSLAVAGAKGRQNIGQEGVTREKNKDMTGGRSDRTNREGEDHKKWVPVVSYVASERPWLLLDWDDLRPGQSLKLVLGRSEVVTVQERHLAPNHTQAHISLGRAGQESDRGVGASMHGQMKVRDRGGEGCANSDWTGNRGINGRPTPVERG
ncbi:uncharacterized protein SPSK_05614 [Sporothrix schenckii 1099-18]|uniref:Uncharacterized protein n=1 Tax=Sporothrix schenckii 1099-18 TaxID=1397361 RepID=A0A0F2LST7_SPOSC|nr:uncharacterized protein SPSK_05614 [Sporothrix schenckii 1099-18]KJR80532.1 hypothetical protein SPSK_05614 [Sporothrix schenckii 1099-18]